MKRLSSTLLNITTIICFIVSFIYYMIFLNSGLFNYGHYTADIIYPYFFVLTTPCLNLFRYTKKIKTGIIYNIVTSIIFSIVTYFTLDGIIHYFKSQNYSTDYFFPKTFIFIIILFVINYIMNKVCKYEKFNVEKDKTNLLLGLMFIQAFMTMFANYLINIIHGIAVIKLDIILFVEMILIIFICTRKSVTNISSINVNMYALLFLINILTFNPFGIVFTILLYIYNDKYGTFL